MQTFCWHVLANPRIYEKLVAEILSAPLSEVVQYQEAQSLPYFQACVKEALRTQPAFAMNICRKVPAGGAELDGTFFPENTEIAFNGWVVHRSKELYGEDAHIFRPERWLEVSEEQAKKMERLMIHVRSALPRMHWQLANRY